MKLVGIDIGGTKILIAKISGTGILKESINLPMSNDNYRKVLEKIIIEIKKFRGGKFVD